MFSSWLTSNAAEKESAAEQKRAQAVEELRQLLSGEEGTGVASALLQGGELDSEEELTSSGYLHRWLRARDYNVGVTLQLIKRHSAWRVRNMPKGYVDESQVEYFLNLKTHYVQGCDRQGRSLVVIQVDKHFRSDADLRPMRHWISYVLDVLVAACDRAADPERKTVALIDLTGAGMANMDVAGVQEMFKLLNTYYVERLGTLYFYNPPLIFHGIWNTFRPLLPEVTRQKVQMIDPSKRKQLLDMFDSQVLPALYGGQAELVPVDEVARRLRRRSSNSSADALVDVAMEVGALKLADERAEVSAEARAVC